MRKKFISHPKNFTRSNLPLKLRLWLILPFRVRFRIERFLYVRSVIANHLCKIDLKVFPNIRKSYFLKCQQIYVKIQTLKSLWYRSTLNRSSKYQYQDSPEMLRFLESARTRFNNSQNF